MSDAEPVIKEIDHKELESFIRRTEEVLDHGLALSVEDLDRDN